MARMRVHELAKELNMNNKELIERIIKLGIQVKNHMSTLSDTAVQKIRQQFDEGKVAKVEEKRIGRAVIRRRKTVTPEETPPPPESPEEPPAVAAKEAPEATPQKAPEPAVSPEQVAPEPAAPAQPEPEGIEPAVAQTAAETLPVEEQATEPPQPAEEPVVEEPPAAKQEPVALPAEEEAPAAVEAELAAEEPKQAVEQPVAEQAAAEPDAETEPAAPAQAQPQQPAAETPESGETAAEPSEEEDASAKAKKTKKRRRKKARKEEPARIIKLPDIIPEEPDEEEVKLPPMPARMTAKTDEAQAKEPTRKKRGRREETEKDTGDRKRRGAARKEVFEREDLYSQKELAAQADRGRMKGKEKPALVREGAKPEPVVAKPGKRRIKIDEAITVANLAKQMGVKASEVIKKLLLLGLPAHINQALDFDAAALVASEFEFEVEKTGFEEEEILQVQQDRPEDLQPRPPVITVMGHVDHGKTSLLDAIRDTNVIEGEAGGITQHIGAYYVKLKNGDVVFLDTPGHEAFTSMRARGAKVTDLVILVVAADDGVMQQTIEAINHSKAAEVPIIVAINKVDKPNANLERVKRELSEQGLIPEEWGGDVTMVEISAKKRTGIDELLEMVLLQAELLELKANPSKPARGWVIEAKLDKGRGPVATVLIQEGTLKAGDVYVCGSHSGRVRNMFNDRGQKIEQAGPSMPVEVLGFSGVPGAGDDFIALEDEKRAKAVAEHRLLKVREKELSRTTKVTLESFYEQIQVGEVKELNVILKTDVHGSLEAISESLRKLFTSEVKVNLIHAATGAITETDIMLASASNAVVIGFNVRADGKIHELAEQEKVDVRYYDVIYQIISDIKDAMVGMLEPVYQENVIGRAEVRQTFHVPKIGTIAGSYVLDGRIERNAKVRILRDQVVIVDGKISSLKRFKDDVKEVKAGFECGIGIENYNDIKVGDIFEAYELQEVAPTLEIESENRSGSGA